MHRTSSTLKISNELAVDYDLYINGEADDKYQHHIIVLCHGFSGFRRGVFLPKLAEDLVDAGFAVISIGFPKNGVNIETGEIVDIDSFSKNTFQDEQDALLEFSLAILNGSIDSIANDQIAGFSFFGHSRGGMAALSLSSAVELKEKLNSIVVWLSLIHI